MFKSSVQKSLQISDTKVVAVEQEPVTLGRALVENVAGCPSLTPGVVTPSGPLPRGPLPLTLRPPSGPGDTLTPRDGGVRPPAVGQDEQLLQVHLPPRDSSFV